MNTKVCTLCQKELSSDRFQKKKDMADGLKPYCRECSSLLGREWYKQNKDKKKEYNRVYYQRRKHKY